MKSAGPIVEQGKKVRHVLMIWVRGEAAVKLASEGVCIYVFNAQRGWVQGDAAMLERAKQMSPHAKACYGVNVTKNVARSVGCG